MAEENNPEIWSEFFRIKNRLMDYDENLREAVVNIRMLQTLNMGMSRIKIHTAKAQKHVALVLDLGIACGAIPSNFKEQEMKFVKAVARGERTSVEDFERCQEFFRSAYQHTKFYDVTITKDNRPAVIKKYGKSF